MAAAVGPSLDDVRRHVFPGVPRKNPMRQGEKSGKSEQATDGAERVGQEELCEDHPAGNCGKRVNRCRGWTRVRGHSGGIHASGVGGSIPRILANVYILSTI